ncbi:hypothetical protein [Photobacterium phosphoreum]|uniref:hypothetical protein n=1 Tax=Photobacterium phosphoreum TaxID=659 RepID=UPI000D17079F|nr:hypothetical protein [Photobacterium phosphoreum]PSU67917.1 hypothetical protein CTM79_14840 [Photobacterium phosphoreum]
MKATRMKNVEEKNRPHCSHSRLSKEYHLGSATGDYVCDDCGKSGFGRNWSKSSKKQEQQ